MTMLFLDRLQRHSLSQPDKVAIELLTPAGPQSLRYGELERQVGRCMAWLMALGLRPGACAATQLPRGLAFVQLHLAICRLGAVHLPLNPAFPVAELRYFLADSGATLFFHAADHPGTASIAEATPDLTCIALRDDDSYTRQIDRFEPVAPPPPRDPQQLAMMLYTSGTTSRPKGARITHGNLTANIEALHEAWGWRQDDVLLHVLPLFHVHGLTVALHGALRAGATAVLTPRFDAVSVLDLLESRRFSVFMGVPTIHRRLYRAAAGRSHDLRHLRLMTSGSDRLPDDLFEGMRQRFGVTLLERYGMTETGMNLSNPLRGERRRGSVGLPLPGVEARVVDRRTGAPLPDGAVGELQIRGPHVCAGYHNQPGQTAAAFTADGWLRTGDLAERAPDGYFTLQGRAKDLIISGGMNVYPPEVERALLEHPDVRAAAVIGCADEEWGERVVALVVPEAGSAPGQADLEAWCRARLAPYKVPRVWRSVGSLPQNALGKVRKAELREAFCGQAAVGR
ncbi:MAG: acyl-CoA synthetase [Anaerolineaceae bacterium]|nr:acyl-CoA synthetase [Anaerolineaceae bacterium]